MCKAAHGPVASVPSPAHRVAAANHRQRNISRRHQLVQVFVTSPRQYSEMLAIGSSSATIPCMTAQPCAVCGNQTEVQAFAGLSAVVDYYLCKRCGHVWAVHKNDPTIIDHFRPLKKPNVNV
jgi:hypothetical protein